MTGIRRFEFRIVYPEFRNNPNRYFLFCIWYNIRFDSQLWYLSPWGCAIICPMDPQTPDPPKIMARSENFDIVNVDQTSISVFFSYRLTIRLKRPGGPSPLLAHVVGLPRRNGLTVRGADAAATTGAPRAALARILSACRSQDDRSEAVIAAAGAGGFPKRTRRQAHSGGNDTLEQLRQKIPAGPDIVQNSRVLDISAALLRAQGFARGGPLAPLQKAWRLMFRSTQRTALGVSQKGDLQLVLFLDGLPGRSHGITLAECALLMKSFGNEHAMALAQGPAAHVIVGSGELGAPAPREDAPPPPLPDYEMSHALLVTGADGKS